MPLSVPKATSKPAIPPLSRLVRFLFLLFLSLTLAFRRPLPWAQDDLNMALNASLPRRPSRDRVIDLNWPFSVDFEAGGVTGFRSRSFALFLASWKSGNRRRGFEGKLFPGKSLLPSIFILMFFTPTRGILSNSGTEA